MRLAEGIVVDKDQTFGAIKFSAMRREVFERDVEGNATTVVKERTYDLKSRGAGMMIQVSIPGEIAQKEFAYDAEVDLIDPTIDTVANATYRGADVSWYIKAKDIVLKKAGSVQTEKEPGKNAIENNVKGKDSQKQ